jgi:hypothetical protein
MVYGQPASIQQVARGLLLAKAALSGPNRGAATATARYPPSGGFRLRIADFLGELGEFLIGGFFFLQRFLQQRHAIVKP